MEEEVSVIVEHRCGDFVLSASRYELYQLGIYPLRCRVCGLQKPNIIAEHQYDTGTRDSGAKNHLPIVEK